MTVVEARVSARTISESQFKKLKETGDDPIIGTIVADHVCVFGYLEFVELIGKKMRR